MSIYAEQPRRRARQLAADIAAVLWIVLWVVAGLRIYDLVNSLGEPGRAVESAGRELASVVETGRTFVGAAGLAPFIGEALDEGFDTVAGAGTTLSEAGADQQDFASQLARWLALAVAGLPIVWLLLRYLPGRLRGIQDARAAAALRGQPASLQLLGLRALVHQPLSRLLQVSDDPAASYWRGEYAPLAALELDSLGLNAEAPARATT